MGVAGESVVSWNSHVRGRLQPWRIVRCVMLEGLQG
jgi:hypothetical protein